MSKYSLVIFDVDGTLLDTSEGILASVLYTIEKYGLHGLDNDTIKTFIGPPITESFTKTYHLDKETAKDITETFRNQYKEYDLLKAEPYTGMYDLFDYLKESDIQIAIATYKRQDYAEIIVKHFGFDKYTDIIYGADNDNKLKKKDIIEKCISSAKTSDKHRILMLGDSENDAVGANALGINFLGVTYGFGFKSKAEIYRSNAVFAANNVNEVISFIERGYKNED